MSAPQEYRVSIGQPCARCKRDDWLVKRAFKVCACGQKCWTRKEHGDRGAIHYRYFQGDTPPADAVVIGPTEDTPYDGEGSERRRRRERPKSSKKTGEAG